jgi:hypothetical protein
VDTSRGEREKPDQSFDRIAVKEKGRHLPKGRNSLHLWAPENHVSTTAFRLKAEARQYG